MTNKNIHNLTRSTDSLDDSEFLIIDSGKQPIGVNIPSETSSISFRDIQYIVNTNSDLSGIKGEKGAKGETGEAGLKGIKGDPGIFGIRGQIGETGLGGESGNKGFVGVTGGKGELGDIGRPAKRGSVGETGSKGNKGVRGNQGQSGDTGEQGDKGFKGYVGRKGDTGEKGLSAPVVYGRTGSVGQPGKKVSGAKGYKGFRGPESFIVGDRGDRGEYGRPYSYSIVKRSFKETRTSPIKHGRILLLLMTSGTSSSISITSNETIMKYVRKRRFLTFELSNANGDLISEKYSNSYIEVDFEPFISYNQSPVVTKMCPVVVQHEGNVGTIGMDWYKDHNEDYHIMFYGIFADTNETIQIPIKSVYSFTSNHLYEIISAEYENLRI